VTKLRAVDDDRVDRPDQGPAGLTASQYTTHHDCRGIKKAMNLHRRIAAAPEPFGLPNPTPVFCESVARCKFQFCQFDALVKAKVELISVAIQNAADVSK